MKIKLDVGAYEPVRAHSTDAGLDLRTPADVLIPAAKMLPHGGIELGYAVIDTGVHVELPHGCYGKIEGKSGLNVLHGIVSLGGVIDEGYTGSIVVKLYNTSSMTYRFEAGDKIAQLIIQPYLAPEIEIVDELGETDRGDSGFGSSGR